MRLFSGVVRNPSLTGGICRCLACDKPGSVLLTIGSRKQPGSSRESQLSFCANVSKLFFGGKE